MPLVKPRTYRPFAATTVLFLGALFCLSNADAQPSSGVNLNPGNESVPSGENGTGTTTIKSGKAASAVAAEDFPADYDPVVTIDGNETTSTSDDIVQYQKTINCTLKWANPTGDDPLVVVVNVSSGLTLPDAGPDGYQYVSLPNDGSGVNVRVYGQTKSTTYGNRYIHAHVDNVYTTIVGQCALTVFYFDSGHSTNTAGNGYYLTNTGTATDPMWSYSPTGNLGVTSTVRVNVLPSGVDVTAPQVQQNWVGLVQNSVGTVMTAVLSNPVASRSWAGTPLTVPQTHTCTWTAAGTLLDTVDPDPTFPWYYPAALVHPGYDSSTADGPQLATSASYIVTDNNGFELGQYYYNQASASLAGSYVTYCTMTHEDSRTTYVAMRQNKWYLGTAAGGKLLSSNPGQKVQCNSTDTTVNGAFVTSAPSSKKVLNDNFTDTPSATTVVIPAP